jgi:uncharacterized tellurite resistance protein B-like protein
MAMTANIDPTNVVDLIERLDLSSLPEAQRLAFYGSMLAVAAADGTLAEDELDLIFQTIDSDGLSERSRSTIWEYLVETPQLTDCLASFTTSHEHLRCAIMLYLISIALADRSLAAGEDEALLQARTCLGLSQKQIEAIEGYICNVGLVRARLRDYHGRARLRKFQCGVWLVAGVSLSAMALYLASLVGGVSLPEMFSPFPHPGVVGALLKGVGLTALIGTAAVVTGRWWYSRYQQNRLPLATERRRRAQTCVRNLQDAISYLTAKAKLHTVVGDPRGPSTTASLLFAERLWMLQQMLTRRHPNPSTATAILPGVPRLSSH